MQNRKKFKYKGLTVNMFGIPISKERDNHKKHVRREYLDSFVNNNKSSNLKNLLIVYDIPEKMKRERDWLRRQLINFNFMLIQRSVWIGPSPLPKYFLDYLTDIGLKDKFKIFKLEKPYIEN